MTSRIIIEAHSADVIVNIYNPLGHKKEETLVVSDGDKYGFSFWDTMTINVQEAKSVGVTNPTSALHHTPEKAAE